MSKRKQRSTAIRKRIEKKQREEQRAKRKAQKASGAGGGDTLVFFKLPRARVVACHAALVDLEARLAQGSLRGWSPSDLQGEHGLAWFGRVLGEALEGSEADPLTVEFLEQAKHPLLERMGALELAASGLRVPWDEAGFDDLLRALSQAEEVSEEEEEEEEEEPAEASGDETTSADETTSGDETAEGDQTSP